MTTRPETLAILKRIKVTRLKFEVPIECVGHVTTSKFEGVRDKRFKGLTTFRNSNETKGKFFLNSNQLSRAETREFNLTEESLLKTTGSELIFK